MKNEIKEILEYWKFYINEPSNYKLLNVHFDEIKKVLDYITNLQTIEQQYSAILSENAELQNKLNQYENPDDMILMFMWCDEKAKDKIKQLQERCEYLERSNNRREDEIISLRDECVDGETYKLRNKKAIKCIKDKYYKEEYERKGTFANKLMNILQGEDKDE